MPTGALVSAEDLSKYKFSVSVPQRVICRCIIFYNKFACSLVLSATE